MSSNVNISIISSNVNLLLLKNVSTIEVSLLFGVTISGIIINLLTMLFLLIIPAYRNKSSCFLFHHCIICLTLSILCLPYSLSFSYYSIRCDYLGNIQVTCVTGQLLNMAAMVASEAYRFEDLIHQETTNHNDTSRKEKEKEKEKENEKENEKEKEQHSHIQYFQYQLKQSDKSTISCGCLSFGIIIIWFSSVILHLGITMIGSESKSYYHEKGKYCNFIITDIRGYVLTLMWIIITTFSLIITVRYIHKILSEVSSKRRTNQPLLSLAILGQSHGQSIASRDILMQQIEQRIKLNILLIILFILFWFPLFLVTLWDIKFKIPEKILRYLLLVAWSNSSLSPLAYSLLLPKCGYLCSFCWKKDRSSTYDSLTSYYNRIGDRFHDIGKWDQYKQEEEEVQREKVKSNRKVQLTTSQTENETENDNDNDDLDQHYSKRYSRQKKKRENHYPLTNILSSSDNNQHSKTNSLIVKEICQNEDSTSSLSSLTTVTTRPQHLSNGLLVTSSRRVHL